MTRFRRRPRGSQGFTLIEVMFALLILGLGLLAIGVAQLTAIRIAAESKQMSQATYLAQDQMELFSANPPIAAGTFQDPLNPIDVDGGVDDDLTTFNRSWTVQPNTPQAGLSTVSVQVTWNNGPGGGLGAGLRTVTLQGIVRP